MNDGWQSSNERYLVAAIMWLRLRLSSLVASTNGTVDEMLTRELAEATSVMSTAEAAQPPPALVALARRFGLSRFEQETLLLCISIEFDTRIAPLCGQAQGVGNKPYPTFGLAMVLFDQPAWDVVSPERPLRYWQLIEINSSGNQPITTSPLRVDERIGNYIKGLNYLDDRLALLLTPLDELNFDLPFSQASIVTAIVQHIEKTAQTQAFTFIQLLGIDGVSKRLIARDVIRRLGLYGYAIPSHLLPHQTAEIDHFNRLWGRERALLPIALYIDASESDEANTRLVSRLLSRARGVVFYDTRETQPQFGYTTISFEIQKPTDIEQRDLWLSHIEGITPDTASQLASQFSLHQVAITEIARTALYEGSSNTSSFEKYLWEQCVGYTRPRLGALAQRVIPKATWDQLVLPKYSLMLLNSIADQVRHRMTVYDDWGFRQRMTRGLGTVALFSGESGTGKTMAAEVIAQSLNLDLYRIDLSAVVSKYIGETEKNLRSLFDAAEDGGAILFFDEADSLFGKRSQVRDSHDRYANIEVNYLLQRMEAFQGLAILATNAKSDLDQAFLRRFRFVVNFPFPTEADRARIWSVIFPLQVPIDELNYKQLAQHNLAGGSIYNAALNAAFIAAQQGTSVTMQCILSAIRMEFVKSDRLINENEFIWEGAKEQRT